MTFTEKLDILMADRGISRGGLSRETGIPYTTIVGFYQKGSENIKLSNLKKLASYFDVSLEYLCGEDDPWPAPEQGLRAAAFSKKYASLSEREQQLVSGVIDGLLELRTDTPAKAPAKIEYIREYVTPAAAGYTSPAEGEDYILVPRGTDVPPRADFAVRIDGDSMEPVIRDGSRVYVSRTNELEPGDVGIFFVDGDMKCKQYCEDSFGNIYLFSLNRARRDADVTVMASSGITVCCFGKVLLDRRPRLPND